MKPSQMEFVRNSTTVTKVDRYGWTLKDKPGDLIHIDKKALSIHPSYQRHSVEAKVKSIASSWSWIACGAIIIGARDGEYWVIDGQHRVLAAMRRADIELLPCLVFETKSIQQEAVGFLNANTGRKPITGLDKFRASIAAGDETALYVDSIFNELGIVPSQNSSKPLGIKSMAWSMSKAKENSESFETVVRLAAEICSNRPLHEVLLDGMYYLHNKANIDLNNKWLRDRIKKIGPDILIESAKRASAYFARGGAKIWADGMLSEINKGVRNKVVIVK